MEKYDLKFRYLKQNKAIKCRRTKNGKLSGEKTDETIEKFSFQNWLML